MNKRLALKNIASSFVSARLMGAFGTLGASSAAAWLAACSDSKPQFASVDITGADYAKDLALTDHNGQARTLKDFAGKVVVLFFGYTQCPDVCPTTLQELQEVKRLLENPALLLA